MTLVPSNSPTDDGDDKPKAIRVETVRVDSRRADYDIVDESAVGGVTIAGGFSTTGGGFTVLGGKASGVVGAGGRTLFSTVKWLSLLALVLALAAAWWAENGNVLRGILAALLVFVPGVAIAVAAGVQRAAMSLAVATWRSTGLASGILNLLLERVAGKPEGTVQATDVPVILGRFQLSDARLRLKRAVTDWTEKSPVGGVIGRAQRWAGGLVQAVALRAFRDDARATGEVDLARVRDALAGRIDDLVADQVRGKSRSALFGAILAMIAWALLIAWGLQKVWS